MAETFSDWKLICDEDYRLYGNVDDWGEAAYQAGQASRDDEIRERDARIAKLEQVVEAARTICDATYVHEMINAATDIRKALAELEGE